ncbi:anaphase-promoting complex subunit CDC26-like [Bombus vosnesenskii]|uniref:Anaphase-promoting complex subunit CDC26 n=2 Tax=Pyrobombus TaxID=144703 RepID=A0A6J3JVK3_9HYME|nr:anaphase-promoting complex subunit CDC26-like [Bombus impatiens]XP_033344249.1 anaphase-promoting complex subunit CDC26-like [Bombus vosnesenskii]XP_043601608.1 anaphase-promoting complex subunit CDC26-like [Bombus pyrosoma]XP_043601609.1 anaphase-promoting complex subunit CDC26-like [Bombus pyrosoma]XP_043601610.1 anaphase-promoting complex subunit CDC26-like [Bombus pyrosoma]
MIRRSPTRIDLRLDDLQEYEAMRKALEAKKESERPPTTFNPPPWGGKIPQSEIQERIGYMPQQAQTTHCRPNL